MRGAAFFCGLSGCLAAGPAFASETITYTYDALGRLTHVAHAGTVNNGLQSNYTLDPADNRTNVTVSGAPMMLAKKASSAKAPVRTGSTKAKRSR
jgi:hypothetical protein